MRHQKLIIACKKETFGKLFGDSKADPRSLWRHLHNLTGRAPPPTLPANDSAVTSAERLSNHFSSKIAVLKSSVAVAPQLPSADIRPVHDRLSDFRLASESEIISVVMSFAQKSCELDPLPTFILRRCIKSLLPALTIIVNRILDTQLPKILKSTILRPPFKEKKE